MSKIKLSICIPTVNRGGFIGETLESIATQFTDELEIVIVDGGSTDNTQQVVEHFQERFPQIRYVRKNAALGSPLKPPVPSGAGFDRDCNCAVEMASGEYCWLFTDDDLLKPGAVQTVLEAMRREYALIVVNAEVRSGDLLKTLQRARMPQSSDRVYPPEENQKIFTDVANYLSFVGGVVIKRQLWLEREKERYIGTGFIHIGVLFQRPIPGQTLLIAEPLVSIRYGDALYMRSSRYFEIWMFIWPNLIWSFPHFSDAAKRVVCRKEPWRQNLALLLYRARGAYSRNEYDAWLEGRLNSRWNRFKARMVAAFPGPIANLMAVAYCYMRGSHSALLLVDVVKSPFYFSRVLHIFGTESKDSSKPIAILEKTKNSRG